MRQHTTISTPSVLQAILGWSDAYVDELFVAADLLSK